MEPLNSHIREYTAQLGKGQIQKAYRGIMAFMSDLKSDLERHHPASATGALYIGYMDMTYFAFTPPCLRQLKLKIAIVYLHEENRFELWLAAANRQVQASVINQLSNRDIGRYALSQVQPGVDAIIASAIATHPDFDSPDELKQLIETETIKFSKEMVSLLSVPGIKSELV